VGVIERSGIREVFPQTLCTARDYKEKKSGIQSGDREVFPEIHCGAMDYKNQKSGI
jgi:hypothetical protein